MFKILGSTNFKLFIKVNQFFEPIWRLPEIRKYHGKVTFRLLSKKIILLSMLIKKKNTT